jgi:hypothetical protein
MKQWVVYVRDVARQAVSVEAETKAEAVMKVEQRLDEVISDGDIDFEPFEASAWEVTGDADEIGSV